MRHRSVGKPMIREVVSVPGGASFEEVARPCTTADGVAPVPATRPVCDTTDTDGTDRGGERS
ncbi:hypothetical protein ACFUJU_25550 [Streptomyces sp. NPDC057235]|uniref:hypothetical protein n=1 Tax=Streptomyces sp. NPDC057235 TaxID=3346058 RepID=UPI0036407314